MNLSNKKHVSENIKDGYENKIGHVIYKGKRYENKEIMRASTKYM